MASNADARKRFEAENKITTEDPDQIYKFDCDKHQAWVNQRLWTKEYFFNYCPPLCIQITGVCPQSELLQESQDFCRRLAQDGECASLSFQEREREREAHPFL